MASERSQRSRLLESEPGSRAHVVVLDDDPQILRGVERLLQAAGFSVLTTTEPKRAMDRCVRGGADAIVCDLHMPEISGNTVLAMLAQAAPNCARLLFTSETNFAVVAAASAPFSLHAMVAKSEATTRLVPVLVELTTHGRPDDAIGHESEARSVARGIVRALALRDVETEAHCSRVAAWSRRLALAMGLGEARQIDVELGALLHDVGKIGVRDAVLLKPGPLTDDEWREMRRHPELGVAMLSDIPYLQRAVPIVESHHERRDGKGYPHALSGDDIPIDARIFQVADAYDAITSDRPYRVGREDHVARAEIAQWVGPQFDPKVFDAFMSIPVDDWRSVVGSGRNKAA